MNAQQAVNEENEVLLKTLQQADRPLTISQIRKQLPSGKYKLSEKRIAEILDDQLRQQRVYRFKPSGGKSDRYWTRDHEDYARETILKRLDERPMTRSDLIRRTNAELRDCSEEKRRDLLNRMLKEGALRKWPAMIGGRSELFSTRPPDSQFYIEHALTKLCKKLDLPREKLIEDAQRLLTRTQQKPGLESGPASEPDREDFTQLILDRIIQIKPAAKTGALVSLTELRGALKDKIPDKASFDEAVIRLAEQESVALQYHDFPASLNQDELNGLVTDGRGNYYIGVSLRL